MTKLAAAIAAMALSLGIIGCSGLENPEPEPIVYNIVTYDSSTPDGSTSTFTYQVNGDSPVITLTANWNVPDAVKPGMRLLLAYTPESSTLESGHIELLGYTIIPGGFVKISEDIPSSEPMHLNSIWRSGNYLNLNGTVTVSGQVSEISLYADESTLLTPEPHAYIIIGKGDGDLPEAAERKLYASWDISDLWSTPSLEALRVSYIDASNKPQTIKLMKQ